jgi:hypothetical protein
MAEFDQRGQQVWTQFNIANPPSGPGRVDVSLVGRWECVATAGSVAGGARSPWELSGSCFVRFGADGHGRSDWASWRASVKLAGRSRALLFLVDGMREFTYSADGRSYQEVPGHFTGNVRCTHGRARQKEAEVAFQFPQPTNCNYMVTGAALTLYCDAWRRDYRRCGQV